MPKRSRTIRNIKDQRGKYPILTEKIIDMSDIILEILDSRFINETRNFEIEKKIIKKDKKIIYVLNKSDLIDVKQEKNKIEELKPKVFVSCSTRAGIKELRDKIKILSSKIENPSDKFLNKVTVGIIGYPNTGKS